MNDWQLLQEYAARQSEEAFRTLVERYLNLVHAVALRQVRSPELAQDVAQTVFVLLARKANGVSPKVILSGWLFRTTRFVAAHVLRAEFRRQRREQETLRMQPPEAAHDPWTHLAPAIDGALEHLGETDRHAVLLKYYQGRTLREVGTALGMSEEAAKKRVSRALEKLRGWLAGHGIELSVTVLSAALAEHAAEAAPASLAGQVLAESLSQTAATPPAALVRECDRAWSGLQFRRFAAVGLGMASVAFLLSLVVNPFTGGPRAVAPEPAIPRAAPVRAPAPTLLTAGSQAPNRESGVLTLKVFDAQTGAPIPQAPVLVEFVFRRQADQATDTQGRCAIAYGTEAPGRMDIGVAAPGYAYRCLTWRTDAFGPPPAEYSLKLVRGVRIGGRVVNTAGEPVAGAQVTLSFPGEGDSSAREPVKERHGLPNSQPPIATDAQGNWSSTGVPANFGEFWVQVKHPEYLPVSRTTDLDSPGGPESERLSIKDLWAGTVVIVLPDALGIAGVVTDELDQPIVGADIRQQSHKEGCVSGPDGRFRLRPLPAGKVEFTVSARDYAPERVSAVAGPDAPPVRVRLKPGATLLLRVVDETGDGVAEAWTGLEEWRGRFTLTWHGHTDSQGYLEWRSAPREDNLKVFAHKPGFIFERGLAVKPDGSEQVIKLTRAPSVAGRVSDAATGEPIPKFKVMGGEGVASPNWDRSATTPGSNGVYSITLQERQFSRAIRVEAEGYEPACARVNGPQQDFALRRSAAAQGIVGVVRTADGSPVAGAEVALCTPEHPPRLAHLRFTERASSLLTQTDRNGRFRFATVPDAHAFVAVHALGFARASLEHPGQPLTLTLEPWGRIEGTLQPGGRPEAGRKVTLTDEAWCRYHSAMRLDDCHQTETDAQGRFTFEHVPAGILALVTAQGRAPVEVLPGQTTRVSLGGTGGAVRGRLSASAPDLIRDWTRQTVNASLQSVLSDYPTPSLAGDSTHLRREALFWLSEAGTAYLRAHPSRAYYFTPRSDGSFEIQDVLPGVYRLQARVLAAEAIRGNEPISPESPTLGFPSLEVSVPENGGTATPIDLGLVRLPLAPPKSTR